MSQEREHVVGRLEELPLLKPVLVRVGGSVLGVYRLNDTEVVAYENACPHLGGPVCQGEIVEWVDEILAPSGEVIEQRVCPDRWHLVCPWHGLEFDLQTGRCVSDPELHLRAYSTRVEGGVVRVRV